MTYKIICTILFSFFIALGFAQDNTNPDYLYAKNGSRFQGKLIEYEQGGRVRFELMNGTVLVFHDNEVRKILQGDPSQIDHVKAKRNYAFKEQGRYLFISGLTSFGQSAFNSNESNSGVGLHAVVGIQKNRYWGYGLGVGTDLYYIGSGHQFIPVYAEFRGYLNQKNAAPYYSVQTGYGFALKKGESDIDESKGGIYFHPAIGLRCGASDNVNFTIDLGVKFQKGSFTTDNWTRITQEMTYRRFVLRVGALF